MIPLVFTIARRTGMSLVKIGIPLVAGLSVVHGLVPPHPAAMLAVGAYEADVGLTIRVYPGEALFKARDQWPAMVRGRLDMTALPLDYMSGRHPQFSEPTVRAELGLYAAAWERLTGQEVAARILLFTATGDLERW